MDLPDLTGSGLRVMGQADLSPSDGYGHGHVTLLGPDEPAFWPIFVQSEEYNDTAPDPLDRWSRRLVDELAEASGTVAVYPSNGPPYPPFQRWAQSSGVIWQSPVNLLVHEQTGLWVSFRAALIAAGPAPAAVGHRPCDSCPAPCETACPVGALTPAGYDVAACRAHVNSPQGMACRFGCLVRRACPVGADRRLPDQSAFHMKAFL